MSEPRPQDCRNRLRDEGKAYPRSGCLVCKDGGLRGCPYEGARPLSALPVEPAPALVEGVEPVAWPAILDEIKAGINDTMLREPWEFVMCDDQRPMVATPGDVVCHADYNHGSDGHLPDAWDVANFKHIARLSPDNVTTILDYITTLSAELARVTELLKAAERERDAAVGRAEQAERLHSELNSREMARRAQAMRGGT
jgi:hypothetical protein